MFRASHITSACGGLLFGGLVGVDAEFEFAPLAFFPVAILFVVGWPQCREAWVRRRERAACQEIHRSGDWQRFRDDMSLVYIPGWLGMLPFMVCTICAVGVVKHYAA